MEQTHWELIKLRKINKVSQESMANLLGINTSTYSKKENGHNDFKASEMYQIAKFFNRRLDEIFLPRNISISDK